jgi:hypothetical protein
LVGERQDAAERDVASGGRVRYRLAVLGVTKVGTTVGWPPKMRRRGLSFVGGAPHLGRCVSARADEQ